MNRLEGWRKGKTSIGGDPGSLGLFHREHALFFGDLQHISLGCFHIVSKWFQENMVENPNGKSSFGNNMEFFDILG